MRKRKGQVLLYVLVAVAVLLAICVNMVSRALQGRMLSVRSVAKEEAVKDMQNAAAVMWGCLADAGYPAYGVCVPTAAQLACVPSRTRVGFSGVWPDCKLGFQVEK